MRSIDFGKVTPVSAMAGEDDEDTSLLQSMLSEAESYLLAHPWCDAILDAYFGLGVGGVVAVFLFRIQAACDDIDDYVWTIVGDLPPLYVSIDDAPNPACALDGYIGAMQQWADAAIGGCDVCDLAPVAAPATKENGMQLRKRLGLLDRQVLAYYEKDLAQD